MSPFWIQSDANSTISFKLDTVELPYIRLYPKLSSTSSNGTELLSGTNFMRQKSHGFEEVYLLLNSVVTSIVLRGIKPKGQIQNLQQVGTQILKAQRKRFAP